MSGPASRSAAAPLDGREEFGGFPNSGLATTVPNLFFARLLPEIESVEELVVSLYFFFAQQQTHRPDGRASARNPRFVSRSELAADATLLRSLARLCGGQDHEALARGLEMAVARGTLFRTTVRAGERDEELYVVNTPAARKALGSVGAPAVGDRLPPTDATPAPNVFALYEENIGSITPLIAEELKEAEDHYPAAWLREAFREAVALNKRSWRYIDRILRRWETEGPDYEKAERDPQIEWLERRYREGKRHTAQRPD